MEFVLSGRRHSLTRQDVERQMERMEPELGRRHFVRFRGKEFPVKQVVAASLQDSAQGLSRLDFTTQQARRVLARLGLEVLER